MRLLRFLASGYLANSRYLCIMECNFPCKIEKLLLEEFNKNFTLCAGKEYFEGNENEMLLTFMKIVFTNKNNKYK